MRYLAVLVLVLAACGDRSERVDFSGEELGPDLHAIIGEDGYVKMGLTEQFVYFTLTDSARAEAQAELDEDAEAGGIRGFFGGIMRGVVGRALEFRARYAVAEIRDVRWEDGRMRIVFNDPERRIDANLQVGEDGDVTRSFSEADVRAFGQAFRAAKEGAAGAPTDTAEISLR